MLIKILIGVGIVLAVFFIIVSLRPADFRIVRSAVIPGPPSEVFDQVNDLNRWGSWSPWEKLDPDMKRSFDGPPTGVGSNYSWEGNKNVGAGRMTIVESRPSDLLRMKLEFFKPFAATNTGEFTFQPEGSGTKVTWSMSGQRNFMMKGASLFMNMDKLVGDQFEEGLANLKSLMESATAKK